MAVVYKWGISNSKYAYLYNPNKEGAIKGPDIVIGEDKLKKIDDEQVSKVVQTYNEEQYKTSYNELVTLMSNSTDNDVKSVQMLDYSYYWNIDDSDCGLVEYGYKGKDGENGVGISEIKQEKNDNVNTITFILTNGKEYDIYINDGEKGADGATGPTGPTGATGATGAKGDKGDTVTISDEEVTSIQKTILDEINPQISGINTSIAALSGYTITNFDTVNQNLSNLTGMYGSLSDTVSSITTDVETIKKNIDGLQKILNTKVDNGKFNEKFDIVDTLEKQVDNHEQANRNFADRINNLGDKVTTIEDGVYGIQTEFKTYKATTSSLKLQVETIDNDLSGLETKYNANATETNSQIKDITQRVNTIEKDSSIDDINTNIDDLQEVNTSTTNKIQSITSTLTEVQTDGKSNSKNIEKIKENYESILTNESTIANNLAKINTELSEISNYISYFNEQITTINNQITTINEKINNKQDKTESDE